MYGDIMPETAGRAIAGLMGVEWPVREPEKQGVRTSACGVGEDEVILLERIERPKSAADMPLYYL